MLMNSGLRSGEVRTLRVGAVNLGKQRIRVVIHKSSEEDYLPVTLDLDRELRRWLLHYASEIGRPLRSDDYLFPTFRSVLAGPGHPPSAMKRVERLIPDKPLVHGERVVQYALAVLGYPTKGEGAHTIRRAVARVWFDALSEEANYDAALRTVSALLHHKNVTTTEHYLGVSSEKRRRDERLMGKPFLTALVSDALVIPIGPAAEQSG
jgi:integrase